MYEFIFYTLMLVFTVKIQELKTLLFVFTELKSES